MQHRYRWLLALTLMGHAACVGDPQGSTPQVCSSPSSQSSNDSIATSDLGTDGPDIVRVDWVQIHPVEVSTQPRLAVREGCALENTPKTRADASDDRHEKPLDPPPPQNIEVCDGIDNDDDGLVDEEFLDLDQDGEADCVDVDDDADGVLDTTDSCPHVPNPSQADADMDGIGDACDLDGDGDGVPVDEDCDDWSADIYPHHPEVCDGLDNDCSGVADDGFSDIDKDGIADCVDLDDDNDGVLDVNDTCPALYNPSQYPVDCEG